MATIKEFETAIGNYKGKIIKNNIGLPDDYVTEMQTEWLCGYVGIDKSHPLFGKNADDCDFDVHGGVTFDGFFEDDPDTFYIGFDCHHLYDTIELWDEQYVAQEIEKLAKQIYAKEE